MFSILSARYHQGYRTMKFPEGIKLPDRFRGIPKFDVAHCPKECRACVDACPTQAIAFDGNLKVDLGRCLFCTDCQNACPENLVTYGSDFSLSVRAREDLVVEMGQSLKLASQLDKEMKRVLGRSLKLREVSAGGCNACEADVNVLTTVGWDLNRFGIQFVASPRHADGILVTGPVSQNMKEALLKTYDAIASPKLVIAVGACAISGGAYQGHAETVSGISEILPVDLYIPGCPPHPATTLDGLVRLLGKL